MPFLVNTWIEVLPCMYERTASLSVIIFNTDFLTASFLSLFSILTKDKNIFIILKNQYVIPSDFQSCNDYFLPTTSLFQIQILIKCTFSKWINRLFSKPPWVSCIINSFSFTTFFKIKIKFNSLLSRCYCCLNSLIIRKI